MPDNDPNTPEEVSEIEILRKQLADKEAEYEKNQREQAERFARLEGRLEERNRQPEPEVNRAVWPSDQAGWNAMLFAARREVQNNPDLAPQLAQIERAYVDWENNAREERITRKIARSTFIEKLRDAGFDESDPRYGFAVDAFDRGMDTQTLEDVYLKPLREQKVDKANDDANKDTRENLARRTAIESTGEQVNDPPDPEKNKADPNEDINESVASIFKASAPSGMRIFPKT